MNPAQDRKATLSLDELRNGEPLERDLLLVDQPENPEMREGVNVWIFEENGEFAMPRLGLDVTGATWNKRQFQSANFAFPDGRILDGAAAAGWGLVDALPVRDENGRPAVFGGGPLTFRCLEPFRRWTVAFDGPAVDTTVQAQIAKSVDKARTSHVRLEADLEMAAPAWRQTFAEDDPRPEAAFMGIGHRHEQLFRTQGVLTTDGKSRPFKGTGVRIHRQSVRRSAALGFYGHVWLSALFPDGRAFGCNVYPALPDRPQYNTGFIYQDGRFVDAKVVDAPWLGQLIPEGERVPVVLESELGRTRIEGVTLLSTFMPGMPGMGGLNLNQGAVRFTWDDQTAIGMTERSSKGE